MAEPTDSELIRALLPAANGHGARLLLMPTDGAIGLGSCA